MSNENSISTVAEAEQLGSTEVEEVSLTVAEAILVDLEEAMEDLMEVVMEEEMEEVAVGAGAVEVERSSKCVTIVHSR